MKIIRKSTFVTDVYVLEDGPTHRYMTARNHHAVMQVTRVEFIRTLVKDELQSITIKGIRLRDDGTEIAWETPKVSITRQDPRPQIGWLSVFMSERGISW